MPRNRFSIFDALESKGYFDLNPANAFSRDHEGTALYQGPVPYPKMLYHPQGEEKVLVPGAWEQDKAGRSQYLGEQRELINQIVETEAQHKVAAAEGWHDHPAKAVRARVEAQISADPNMAEGEKKKLLASIPQIVTLVRIAQLEAELAKLQAEAKTEPGPGPGATVLPNGLTVRSSAA